MRPLVAPNSCEDPTAAADAVCPCTDTTFRTDCPAYPGDDLEDRCGFQRAIDRAKVGNKQVCIPVGVFDVGQSPSGTWSLDLDNADKVAVTGGGDQTVVRFLPGTEIPNSDWKLFLIRNGSESVVLRDFTILGRSQDVDGSEQTSAVQIGSCVAEASVSGVTIRNLKIFDSEGDAIRLCGSSTATTVSDIEIVHSSFLSNKRSGVALQRGVSRVRIADNFFFDTSDQDVDSEPSDGTTGVRDLYIGRNVFTRTGPTCYALGLAGVGVGTQQQFRITIEDNLLIGAGIHAVFSSALTIRNNVILGGADPLCNMNAPVIGVWRDSSDVIVSGNLVTRPPTSGAGPLLSVVNYGTNTGGTTRFVSRGNTYYQHTRAALVAIESSSSVSLEGDRLVFDVEGTPADVAAIRLQPITREVRGFSLVGSAIEGSAGTLSLTSVIDFDRFQPTMMFPTVLPYGEIAILRNQATGVSDGIDLKAVLCSSGCASCPSGLYRPDGQCGFANTPMIAENDFDVLNDEVVHAARYAIGGNSGRPWLAGTVAPSGACVTGSLFTRKGGGGSGFCVCEGGAWVVKPGGTACL